MTLPPLTAEYGLGPALGTYHGRARGADGAGAVVAMATTACLSACVGPGAAALCSARCGGDLSCWRACAGITDTGCVAACLGS